MYFGTDYHPEYWVHPYAGSSEHPEARWAVDADLMVKAGMNVVRMGEFSWGLYEPEEGKFDFEWMSRCLDVMWGAGLQVVLGTPTAAPPLWLSRLHPETLPFDKNGRPFHPGTRHTVCLNSDTFWNYSKRIVSELAKAVGNHPSLTAWQIDNGIGAHNTEQSYNPETRRDWHAWLKAKYETTQKLNDAWGTRFWTQVIHDWADAPMPMRTPTLHNPSMVLDWKRFNSDTIVAYVRMQADLLHELTPKIPVTTNLRALTREFDHFDVAEVLDFVGIDSNATIKSRSAENACEIDMLRSLKKTGIRAPEGDCGFWVIEQKAGHVDWQDANSLVRPGVVRLFTYQLISRGASGVLYFYWRQPRIGSEKFYGGILNHDGSAESRVYREISQIGMELKQLAPMLKNTSVTAEVAILITHDNEWSLRLEPQPNRGFKQRDHINLFYTAFHDRNIPVDFARPTEDLSKYKVIIAPSMQLLAGGEADLLKLYVHNGGILVSTFNTGLVDEHHVATDSGYPHDMTDLFGLVVNEFDPLPAGEDNFLSFKGSFPTSHAHPAKAWCDIIEPRTCQVVATYTKDFYAGTPAVTLNDFGHGKAIYIGTMSHQPFYYDLVAWLRQVASVFPLLKVPDTVEVSMRSNAETKVYFLLNHQNTSVRLNFYKPVHDFLSGESLQGNFDLPPHGILVLDEQISATHGVNSGQNHRQAPLAQT